MDHLDTVRQRFQTITDRFAGFQAQWLNVHVDFPLLQRLRGIGAVQTFSGRHIDVGPDGTIEMSADDAQHLICDGWTKLAEWTSEMRLEPPS